MVLSILYLVLRRLLGLVPGSRSGDASRMSRSRFCATSYGCSAAG